MGSVPVGVQCLLTSSLGEFLGYWDWLWYPGLSPVLVSIAIPVAFHISVFLLHQPLDFIRLFFMVVVSAPRHQPSSLFQAWDWHYGNWISEKVEIPWWWNYWIDNLNERKASLRLSLRATMIWKQFNYQQCS